MVVTADDPHLRRIPTRQRDCDVVVRGRLVLSDRLT